MGPKGFEMMERQQTESGQGRGLRRLGRWRLENPKVASTPEATQSQAKPPRRGLVVALVLGGLVAALAIGLYWKKSSRLDLDSLTEAQRIEDFTLRDAAGKAHSLGDWRAYKAVVLYVLGTECPVSNGYAPEMRRIAEAYRARGVGFFGVYPDPDVTAEAAAKHSAEFGLGFPSLLDPNQELTGDVGVRVTPEAVVLDPGGTILYHGRIDDRHSADGKRRDTPRTRELEDALTAALAGRTPAVAEAKAFGCPLPRPRPIVGEGEEITYAKHIAPILQRRCQSCHRPGEVGPFSLLTHRDAAKRADFLHEVVASRRMPPWRAARGFGEFLDETWLNRREIETLKQWAETGAKEGNPADLPPPVAFPKEGWDLGEPDLVLSLPEPFTIPAGGGDVYRAFVLPVPLDHDQPISAVVFRPGNRRVVHHSRVYVDETPQSRGRDAGDAPPGFPSFGGADIQKPTIGQWLPGVIARFPPEGVGQVIKKGSDLLVLIHYHPTGKPETDQSSVGLHFRKTPPERLMTSVPMSTSKIDIPPGESHHRIALRTTLPTDVHAYSVLPHGHFLMKEIKLAATLPDGTVKRLLWIKEWDFNWQGQYHFEQPVALPKGTKLDVVAYYDNSDQNPANPSHPPRRVMFGSQSTDEMLGCHVHVIADKPGGFEAMKKKWPDSL